jgi:ribosomal protein S18 acetylase RimI-like enzyme
MDSPTSSIASLVDDIEVRVLSSSDIKQICDLHASLLAVSYPPQFFRQLILNPTRLCLVAHPAGDPHTLLGFVSASIHATTSDLARSAPRDAGLSVHILTLGVLPACQGNGLARRLVHGVVRKLRDGARYTAVLALPKSAPPASADGTLVRTHVCTDNLPAQKFYNALGLAAEADVLRDVYRTSPCGARDAYTLVGRIR